ncbi:MAG: hypothetical protein HUU55_07440 [Myxococcales bacterium]|nr:hypothetical protein [Myxococcales bacterium]
MNQESWVGHLLESIEHSLKQTAISPHTKNRPIVVVDVDLTIVDNQERTRAILRDYIQSRPMPFPQKSAILETIQTLPIEFSIGKNLAALGIPLDEVRTDARDFWQKRFFSDRYLHYDVPYIGAVEALQSLVKRGAFVAYVTGRIASTMAAGTVREFLHHGFPVTTADSMLIMKTSHEEEDTEFKIRSLNSLFDIGQPVWLVDNEPRICNAWHDMMSNRQPAPTTPRWLVMHRTTRHSPGAPPLHPGIAQMNMWLPVSGEYAQND